MMNKPLIKLFLIFITLTFAASQEGIKVSGYMLGDYYGVVSNHDNSLNDKNGFTFRRIYLGFDHKIDESVSTRLRFEMANSGDFKSESKLIPEVKDAYLKYTTSNTDFILGISAPPTWELIEKVWGYRSLEKTPLDLQKFTSSRDFGLGIKGNITSDKSLRYNFMFANNSSNKSEVNKYKKVMGSLSYYLNESILFEIYADYESNTDSLYQNMYQIFGAYQADWGKFGLQYATQYRKGVVKEAYSLLSLFAVLKTSKTLSIIARYDAMFEPNSSGNKIAYIPFDSTSKASFILFGIDWKFHEAINIMPNIEYATYDKASIDSDIIPRITFKYKF